MNIKKLIIPVFAFVFFASGLFFISNSLTYVSDSQREIIRDTKRLNDLTGLRSAIEAYKTKTGTYPKLDSGTGIKGFVASTWGSEWQNFCSLIGITNCPVDPVNEILNCDCSTFGVCSGSNINENIDKASCYNSKSQTFACTPGSRIYQYQVLNNGRNYSLMMEFEYADNVNWGVSSSAPENYIAIKDSCTLGSNLSAKILSNKTPVCGDSILDYNESCEVNSKKTELCNDASGALGKRVIGCSSSCSWDISNPGQCIVGHFCGDSVKDPGEECDGGSQKMCFDFDSNSKHNWYTEQNRYCTLSCKWDKNAIDSTAYCGGYCGDGVAQTDRGEECDLGSSFSQRWSSSLSKFLSCEDRKVQSQVALRDDSCADDVNCSWVNNSCVNKNSRTTLEEKHCDMSSCKYYNSNPTINFDFFNNRNSKTSYIKSDVWSGDKLQYQSDYFNDGSTDLIIADKQGSDYVAIWNSDYVEIKVNAYNKYNDALTYKYKITSAYNSNIKLKYNNGSDWVDYTPDSSINSGVIRVYPTTVANGSNLKNTKPVNSTTPYNGDLLFGPNYVGDYSINVVVSDNYSLGRESIANPHNATSSYSIDFKIGAGCGDKILQKDLGELCEWKSGVASNVSINNIYMNWGTYVDSVNNIDYQQPDNSGNCAIYSFNTGSFDWKGKLDDISCSTSAYGLCERRASFGCDDWIKGGDDNCYLFTSKKDTWSNSKNECSSLNASLVVVNDAAEELFINNNSSIKAKSSFWAGYSSDGTKWSSENGGVWSLNPSKYDIFRDKIYNGSLGTDASNQYFCGLPWSNGACRQDYGYCGDGAGSNLFEECDKSDKGSYGQGTDLSNQYGCGVGDGVNDNNPNSVLCRDQGGYCTDNVFQSSSEHCDPNVRISASESRNNTFGLKDVNHQYVCQQRTKTNEKVYYDFNDFEANNDIASDNMCRKSFGGYCGDGSIQMFYTKDASGKYTIESTNVDSQSGTKWGTLVFDVDSKKYKYNGGIMDSTQLNNLIEECDPKNYPCDPNAPAGSCTLPKSSSSSKQYGGCGQVNDNLVSSPVVLSCFQYLDTSNKILDCAGSCVALGSYPNKACIKKDNDNDVCTINLKTSGTSYSMVNYTGSCGCKKIHGGYCGDTMVQTQFDEECDPEQVDSNGVQIYSSAKLTKGALTTISENSDVDQQYLCGRTTAYTGTVADLKKRDASGAVVSNSFTAKYSNVNNNEIACNIIGGYCGDGVVQSDYSTLKTQSDQSWFYDNSGTIEGCDPKNHSVDARYSSAKNTYTCGSIKTPSACVDLLYNQKNTSNNYGGYCGDGYIQYDLTNAGVLNSSANYSIFRSTSGGDPEQCDFKGHNILPKESGVNSQYVCGITAGNPTTACTDLSGYCGDGVVNEYLNFAFGEPNGSSAENCVVMDGKTNSQTGDWLDVNCSWTMNYICEQENQANAACLSGFTKWSDGNYNCYSVSADKKAFDQMNCPAGSHPVVINSQDENNFVTTLINGTGKLNDWAYIGLNDVAREGEFVWLNNAGYIEECDPTSPDYKNGSTSRILTGGATDSNVNKQYLCGSTATWSSVPDDTDKYDRNGAIVSSSIFTFDNRNQGNNSCMTFGGYCGDGIIQYSVDTKKLQSDQSFFYQNSNGLLEECDPKGHSVASKFSSDTNQYQCGAANSANACTNIGGYCGDGVKQSSYEQCDPNTGAGNDYSSTSLVSNGSASVLANSSSSKQYKCGKPQKFTTLPGIKSVYSSTGSVASTFLDSDLSSENNTSACKVFGGYCGDGVVQITYDSEKLQSDQSWFYSNVGSLEECDPKNHSVVAQYSSATNSYVCGNPSTTNSCINLDVSQKDSSNNYGGYCGDGYVQYSLSATPLQNNAVNYTTFQSTSAGSPEQCDPNNHVVPAFYSGINNTYLCGSKGAADACTDLVNSENNKSGYCGDGKIQYNLATAAVDQGTVSEISNITVDNTHPEQCDPNGHSVIAKNSSISNTYYCGAISDGSAYACRDVAYATTNASTKLGGYCGDGVLQDGTNGTQNKEECDPNSSDYNANLFTGDPKDSSVNKQYLCAATTSWTANPADKNRYKADGTVDSTFVYNNVNNGDNSCRTFGGYCGDGIIQYAVSLKKLQSDQTFFYTAPVMADAIEQCDPKGHYVIPQYSSTVNQYSCGATGSANACMNVGGYCGDGIVQSAYGEECDPLNYDVPNSLGSSINNAYNCGSKGTVNACQRLYFSDLDVPTAKYGGYCGDGYVQYDLTKTAGTQSDTEGTNWKNQVTIDISHPEQCDPSGYIKPANYLTSSYRQYSCGAAGVAGACAPSAGYCGDSTIQTSEDCDYASYVSPSPKISSSANTYLCGNKTTVYPTDVNHALACKFVDAAHGGGYCGDASMQYCKDASGTVVTNSALCWDTNNNAVAGITAIEQCDPKNNTTTPSTSSKTAQYVCGYMGATDACMDKSGYCGDGKIQMSLNVDGSSIRTSTNDYLSTSDNYVIGSTLEKCDPTYTPTISETNRLFANGNKLPDIYIHSAGNGDTVSAGEHSLIVNGVTKNTFPRSWAVHVFDANWNYVESKNYDVFGSTTEANNMITYLNSLTSDKYVIFSTYDEPRNNIGVIWETLKSFGSNEDTLSNLILDQRGSYLMVGKKGLGVGNNLFEDFSPHYGVGVTFTTKKLNDNILAQPGITLSDTIHYNCKTDCTFTNASTDFCGDGIVQGTNGEQCDPNNYSVLPKDSSSTNKYTCSLLCADQGGYCGDGITQTAYGEECDPTGYSVANAQASNINKPYVCGSVGTVNACKKLYYSVKDTTSLKYGGYCGDGYIQYNLSNAAGLQNDSVASNTWKKTFSVNVNSPENCDPLNYIIPSTAQSASYYQYSCVAAASVNACTPAGGYCGDSVIQSTYEECDHASYITPTVAQSSSTKTYDCGDNSKNVYACQFLDYSNGGGYCGDNYLQSSFGEKCEQTGIESGLVAWLKLNNDATNSAATSITSTPVSMTYAEGKYAKAGLFNGSTSTINLSSVGLNTSAGAQNTVSFWMYWNGTAASQMPISFSSASDLYIFSGNFGFNTGNGDLYGISFPSATYAGKWIHVAAVLYNGTPNSTNNALYINGVKQTISQKIGTSTSRNVSSSVKISSWTGSGSYFFDGMIDDVRLYNRALTVSDITSIHANASLGNNYYSIYNAGDANNLSNLSCTGTCGTVGDGWTCDSDYYWNVSTNACIPVPGNSIKIGTLHGGSDYKCNAGYEKDGLGGCITCVNGKYSNDATSNVCTPCTAIAGSNWTTSGTLANNCQFNCKIGYKYDGAARTCTSCPNGTQNPEGNQNTTCSNCVDARASNQIYSSNNSAGSCSVSNCVAGQQPASTGGGYMNNCASCAAVSGSYNWINPGADCSINCNTNYYKSSTTACTACSAETWTSDNNTDASCTACHYSSWANLQCNGGHTWSGSRTRTDGDSTQCTFLTTTDAGAGSCDYCFPYSSIDTTTCVISNGQGNKDRSCQTNLTWDIYGNCYVISCNAGYYKTDSSTCSICPVGSYCDGGLNPAVSCPAGTYRTTTGGTGLASCTTCPAGNYCTGGSAITQCLAGTYRSTTGGISAASCSTCGAGSTTNTLTSAGATSCTSCAPGTYDNDSNSTTACSSCGAGYYCTGGTARSGCVAGTYSAATNNDASTDCTACGAGYVTNTLTAVAATTCSICAPGTYDNDNNSTTSCITCPSGSYCTGGSAITSCSPGTYSTITGATSSSDCSACGAGYYCTGGSSRIGCIAGTYSAATNAIASTTCTACGAGSVTNTLTAVAATTCSICAPGTYDNDSNSTTACSSCGAGYYCTGGTARSGCAAGTYSAATNNNASTDCTACGAGHYCPLASSSPTNCPAGTYSAATNNDASTDCTACAAGTYCPAGSISATTCAGGTYDDDSNSSTACVACGAGHYCTGGTARANCPAGTYSALTNNNASSDCTACGAGYVTNTLASSGASTCTICAPGTYDNDSNSTTACIACGAGAYCTGGTARTACLDGTYSSATNATSSATCTTCVAGTYDDDLLASTACIACGAGAYCTGGTARTACPDGTYSSATNATSSATCVTCSGGTYDDDLKASTACVACGAGKYCTGGTARANCPAGTYSAATNNNALSDCTTCTTAGTYCAAGSTAPVTCVGGTYDNDSDPSTACSSCGAGYYCTGGTARAGCAAGTYSAATNNNASTDCTACGAGKVTNTLTSTGASTCTSCAGGTYDDDSNSTTACLSCGKGYYCTGGINRTACTSISNRSTWTSSNAASDATCGFTCNQDYQYDGVARTCTKCSAETWTADSNTDSSCNACTYSTTVTSSGTCVSGNTYSGTKSITSGDSTQCTATYGTTGSCAYCSGANGTSCGSGYTTTVCSDTSTTPPACSSGDIDNGVSGTSQSGSCGTYSVCDAWNIFCWCSAGCGYSTYHYDLYTRTCHNHCDSNHICQ